MCQERNGEAAVAEQLIPLSCARPVLHEGSPKRLFAAASAIFLVLAFAALSSLARGACITQDAKRKEGPVAKFGTTVVMSSGFRGEIYHIPPGRLKLPNFEKLKAVGSIYTPVLNIPPTVFSEGFPGVTNRLEWFAIDYAGRFWIQEPGEYRFTLTSDDGSKLYIDDSLTIDNDGIHPAVTREGKVTLSGGIHHIRVSYFQGPGRGIALILAVAGPGERPRIFSMDEFRPPSNPEEWKYGDPRDLKIP